MATAATAPTVDAGLFNPGAAEVSPERGGGGLLTEQSPSPHPLQTAASVRVTVRVTLSQSPTSARSERLLFGALKDPEYRLRKPIPLEVSVGERGVVLSWVAVDEYGWGNTMTAAADDFAQTLRELYHSLYAPTAKLGADLQKVKQILGEFIEPRAK